MSGNVTELEIRSVLAALPPANRRAMALCHLHARTGISYGRLVKVLLCMRAKGLAMHTPTLTPERRRWRVA